MVITWKYVWIAWLAVYVLDRVTGLAGDAMITQPWSHIDDPCFLRLVKEMRRADTTILNLETLIHEYGGYAQLDSGGADVVFIHGPHEIRGIELHAGRPIFHGGELLPR